jgi:hypothetical protein
VTLFQQEKNAEAKRETWFTIAGIYKGLKPYPDAVPAYQQALRVFQTLNRRLKLRDRKKTVHRKSSLKPTEPIISDEPIMLWRL